MIFWYVLHPLADGRWRWAIHLKQPTLAAPLEGSFNAGDGRTRQDADIVGQKVLYSLINLCGVFGMDRPKTVAVEWDRDPFAGRELVVVDTAEGPTVVPV